MYLYTYKIRKPQLCHTVTVTVESMLVAIEARLTELEAAELISKVYNLKSKFMSTISKLQV